MYDVAFKNFLQPSITTSGVANIAITNALFADSTAGSGAAMSLTQGSVASQMTLDKVQFTNLAASAGGGALWINGQHQVVIKDSLFSQCRSATTGGAIGAANAAVSIKQTNFIQNTANQGGVLFMFAPDTDISLEGPLSISGNAAELSGGAFSLLGGRFTISGAICATNNTAGKSGSFVELRGAVLNVEASAVVNVGENSPGDNSTVLVDTRGGGSVTCGSGRASWKDGEYLVQGPLCACSAAFEAGTSTKCDKCGSRGWNAGKCACAECNEGVCCDVADKTFLPSGTECPYNPLDSDAFAPFRRAKANADGTDHEQAYFFYYPYASPRHDGGEGAGSPTYDADDDGGADGDESQEPHYYHRDSPPYYSGLHKGDNSNSHDEHYTRDGYEPRMPDMPPYRGGDREPPYYGGSHGDADWPACYGSCSLGQCLLDKRESGCCYVAQRPHGSNNGATGYAKQSGVGEGYSGGMYGHEKHGRENLMCWKSAWDVKERRYGGKYF